MGGLRIFEKIFKRSLLAVLILVASWAIVVHVSLPRSPQEDASHRQVGQQSANDGRFRPLFDAGSEAIQAARYGEALGDFQEAERSTEQMTADQYASVQNARLQIVSRCEASGRSAEVENGYKALAASAMKQGQVLSGANQCAAAVEKFADAERFSVHLTETKQASLLESRTALAGCLEKLHRVPEAVQATQRMIDDLRASQDQFDPALIEEYMNLAREYSLEDDWNSAERAIRSASEFSDQIIARFAPDPSADAERRVGTAISQKAVAVRWLIIAYQNEGKTDLALSTADAYFNFKLDAGGRWGIIRFSADRNDIAALALQAASKANRQDAIDLWRQRLNSAQ
jgi:hypothetical protein